MSALTPSALVDMYSGDIVADSAEYVTVVSDLRALTGAELRQVASLAPRYSRLARLATVEGERRADARARRRIEAAVAGAVVMVRTERREEV